MKGDLKERRDIIKQELSEITMILGKKTKSDCILDEPLMELMRKVKCKEIELQDLKIKLSTT